MPSLYFCYYLGDIFKHIYDYILSGLFIPKLVKNNLDQYITSVFQTRLKGFLQSYFTNRSDFHAYTRCHFFFCAFGYLRSMVP